MIYKILVNKFKMIIKGKGMSINKDLIITFNVIYPKIKKSQNSINCKELLKSMLDS